MMEMSSLVWEREEMDCEKSEFVSQNERSESQSERCETTNARCACAHLHSATYEEECPVEDARWSTRIDRFDGENERSDIPRSDRVIHVERWACRLHDLALRDEDSHLLRPHCTCHAMRSRASHVRCAIQFETCDCDVQRCDWHEERSACHDHESAIADHDRACASSDCRASSHPRPIAGSRIEAPLHDRHFPCSRRRRMDSTTCRLSKRRGTFFLSSATGIRTT
jgi:hypothetical protein